MLDQLNNRQEVISTLNAILQYEMTGVMRYTNYSLMAQKCKRFSITSKLRKAAEESQKHAIEAGEILVNLGEKPILESKKAAIDFGSDLHTILHDCLDFSKEGTALYQKLLTCVEGQSSYLEEYVRRLLSREEHPELEKFTRFYKSQERYRELFQA